ncbi:hypothetical protein FB45DRAFT_947868 [Roridomyces roridus]|uniref:Uncharacterized protein n=1 Tax=Roridomyces roridus TaxID=1738132 RepID=A0AAD7B2I8_9AGAR|nr:hypothetical protein FB45DRAFT_947868 [Roridomyces roridus]
MATPAPKTLSTSTLSLKFMQNAHRAKNLATVELDKAEVKDDGEWEVAKEVRDAWGSPETETTQSVSYEASFIPFLFGLSDDDGEGDEVAVAKGRRVFKRGREVLTAEPSEPKPIPNDTTSNSKAKKRPITGRGATISGNTGKGKEREKEKGKSKSKTAREAVRDSAGVGADLGKAQRMSPEWEERMAREAAMFGKQPLPAAGAPPAFVKPAGVDAPPTESGTSEKKTKKKGKKRKAEEGEPEAAAVAAPTGVEDGVVEVAGEEGAPSKKRKKSKTKKEGGEGSATLVAPAPSAE